MNLLHYNLYQNGRIGMVNLLMSVENALVIAKLTKRDKIIFYGDGRFFNSENKSLRFDDLFYIDFPYEWIESNDIDPSIPSIPYNFNDLVFYYGQMPSNGFINKRSHFVNLHDYVGIPEFRTKDNYTLGFYSYLFHFPESIRKDTILWVKDILKPMQKYIDWANHYIGHLGSYNSIHFRRGDFVYHQNTIDRAINAGDVLDVIKANFFPQDKLVIHSDELNLEFFRPIIEAYPNYSPIDQELQHLKAHANLDVEEIGLISLLIASHSKNFIGTMESTFTALIQRYRVQNGFSEDFKYLYPKHADLKLENGRFKEESFGEQSWNRVKMPEEMRAKAFWFREWPESFMQKKPAIQQELRIFPNFVTTDEINHIIARSNLVKTENFNNENRDRWTPHVSQDQVIADLIKRACDKLGYEYDNIEPSMQVFIQHEGGQTFWHTDSLYEDYQGKRISSVLFYLNDDFSGSHIHFPYLGIDWTPQKGAMVAYPLINEYGEQDKLWSHSASIITRGTKYMCYFSLKEKPFNKK